MSLGPRNWHKDLHIVINDSVIDQKPEITLLGVTLDDQLSFSSHGSNVWRKASSQTGVLLRLHNLIPTFAKLHIVKFAVIPHLTYCQTVWHFCRSSDARKLERIQKRPPRAVQQIDVRGTLAKSETTNTLYAATISHCNLNVQSKKWPGASLCCGLSCRYQVSVSSWKS